MTRVGWGAAIMAGAVLAAGVISGGAPERAAAQSIVGWKCLPGYGGCDEYGNPYATTANATVIPEKKRRSRSRRFEDLG